MRRLRTWIQRWLHTVDNVLEAIVERNSDRIADMMVRLEMLENLASRHIEDGMEQAIKNMKAYGGTA